MSSNNKTSDFTNDLMEEIKQLGYRMGLNNAFTKFLELTAVSLGSALDPFHYKEREEEYDKAVKGLKPEELSSFARMMALLYLAVRQHADDPKDILGDIYHRLKLNNEWNGQFFTPDNVARMMGMLIDPVLNQTDTKDIITVNEPTCGSGTMILGSVWAMVQKGVDYTTKTLFVAQDIDIRCVWMTYIQLTLYKVPAVVIHSNTLTVTEWSRWYTSYAIPILEKGNLK